MPVETNNTEPEVQNPGFELLTGKEESELELVDEKRVKFLTDEHALDIAKMSGIMGQPIRPDKKGKPYRTTGMNQITIPVKGGRIVVSCNVNWFADKKNLPKFVSNQEREVIRESERIKAKARQDAQAVIASQNASADERAEAELLLKELA